MMSATMAINHIVQSNRIAPPCEFFRQYANHLAVPHDFRIKGKVQPL